MLDGPATPPEAPATPWRRLVEFLEFRPREAVALGVLCVAIAAGAGFAYARSLPRGDPGPAASPLAPAVDPSAGASGHIVVDMAGAVRSPGVYELPAGARVIDGLRAAGGPGPNADTSSVNLARSLTDGERVYVPRRGEAPPPEAAGGAASDSGGGATSRVNINIATASQLEALPGIGQVLAQRIVDYRTQHGPFRSVRDLLKVEGIGEKKFDSIKDYVTV